MTRRTAISDMREVWKNINELELSLQRDFRLGINDAVALSMIGGDGDRRSTKMAKALGVTNSLMSRVIARIESRKFIKRTVGKKDHREMVFSLTGEGEALLREIGEKCDLSLFRAACRKAGRE